MTSSNIMDLIDALAAESVAAGVDCVERSPGHYGPSKEAEDALHEAKARLLIAIVKELEGLTSKVKRLEERIRNQRQDLAVLNEVAKARADQLSAMHWVWCSGGCKGGVAEKADPLTEEIVQQAERNTKRLREWYENAKRKGNAT